MPKSSRGYGFGNSIGGGQEYPFWGREYVAAIEPITSLANRFSDAIDNGTARLVPAASHVKSEMWAWAFEGDRPVTRISGEGIDF